MVIKQIQQLVSHQWGYLKEYQWEEHHKARLQSCLLRVSSLCNLHKVCQMPIQHSEITKISEIYLRSYMTYSLVGFWGFGVLGFSQV